MWCIPVNKGKSWRSSFHLRVLVWVQPTGGSLCHYLDIGFVVF